MAPLGLVALKVPNKLSLRSRNLRAAGIGWTGEKTASRVGDLGA